MLNGLRHKALNRHIHQILQFEDKNFVHRQEWHSITFQSVESKVKQAIDIARKLSELDLRYITDIDGDKIITSCNKVAGLFAHVDLFDISEYDDPNEIHEKLCEDIVSSVEELTRNTKHWITYLPFQHGDMESLAENLREFEKRSQDLLNRITDEAKTGQNQVEEILRSIKEAAAEAGIGAFNTEFRKEGESIKKRAWYWLGMTVFLALGCLVVVVWSILAQADVQNEWALINMQVTKWSILVVLGLSTVWCGRMYRALIHQSTINRQKAIGLQTFQAFTNAASDASTKDAVLLATTNFIFGSHPTGMLDQKTSDKDSSPKILEVSRFINSQSKLD